MRKFWLLFCCLQAVVFGASFEKIRVYEENHPETLIQKSSDYREIADILKTIDVRFEKWEANVALPAGATTESILEAYKANVDKLKNENGYKSVDVVRMLPDSPKKVELRNKFLNEHTHTEDEVRFFVEGSGLFCLHVNKKVYIVLCEAGDLISIPANYPHWFDMSEKPFFTAIRLFIEPDGWIAKFTESGIAQKFPRYEEILR